MSFLQGRLQFLVALLHLNNARPVLEKASPVLGKAGLVFGKGWVCIRQGWVRIIPLSLYAFMPIYQYRCMP